MKDIRKAYPDTIKKINDGEKKKISDVIKREYPEIINFSVHYDVQKQEVDFEGLTEDQKIHILGIVFGKSGFFPK